MSTLTADTRDADLPIFTLQPDTRLRTARFPRILLFVNAYLPRKHAQAHLSFFFPCFIFFFRENSFTLPGLRQIVHPVRSHPRGKSNQLSLAVNFPPTEVAGSVSRLIVTVVVEAPRVISIAGDNRASRSLNEASSSSSSSSSSSFCRFYRLESLEMPL